MEHKCSKEEEIKGIKCDLSEVKGDFNELKLHTAEVSQRIKVMEKRLFGNGIKGLISKIDELTEWMLEKRMPVSKLDDVLDFVRLEKEKKGIERMSRKTMIAIMTLIIPLLVFLGNLVWDIIKHRYGLV